jgi:hypothetical protein
MSQLETLWMCLNQQQCLLEVKTCFYCTYHVSALMYWERLFLSDKFVQILPVLSFCSQAGTEPKKGNKFTTSHIKLDRLENSPSERSIELQGIQNSSRPLHPRF